MISRVAESCFWLMRHIERAENMARLLRVNRSFLLDVDLPELAQWHPVLVVSGEQDRFPERHPDADPNDGDAIQDYLTWERDCPVGITGSVYWARENARTIREVISLDMWEAINAFWHWLRGDTGRKTYERDRDSFYRHIKDSVALFHGACHDTMLHDEPFDFMRLGMLLERAGQTARIMDVKYHVLGPTTVGQAESALETAQWVGLLRSCSAEDTFLRSCPGGVQSAAVIGFLLKEELFPRSVYSCLLRARNFLRRIRNATGQGEQSSALLDKLVQSLDDRSISDILASGLHDELTRLIETAAAVCDAVSSDYFHPVFAS